MNQPLRILLTSPGYKPAYRIGGPVSVVSSLAESLVRKGHLVTVFATNCNMAEDLDVPTDCPQVVDGVEVWYFRREEWLKRLFPGIPYLSQSIGFLYSPAMKNALQRVAPSMDVIHAHVPFIYPTYAAAQAAQIHQKPFFYHQHNVFSSVYLNRRSLKKRLFIGMVERTALMRATTLIALTNAEVESYRSLSPGSYCTVIPNGINVDQFCLSPLCPNILNIPESARVILFMARLHPVKGVDKLIEAFFQIEKDTPDAVLVVAGPDEFGLEKKYKERVGAAGLRERILFPGMVAGQLKKDLLARADLFCLPSSGEGFSMAVLEALASATSVMISPGCYFPEVEVAGVGKVVEPRPEIMADALLELLGDRGKLKQMGVNGRDFVARNYTWDIIADKHVEAYREGICRFSQFQRRG